MSVQSEITFDDRIKLVAALSAHWKTVMDFRIAALEARGKYITAVTNARQVHAKTDDLILDNERKRWTSKEVLIQKRELLKEIKKNRNRLRNQRLRAKRAWSLVWGDQMTTGVTSAWAAMHSLIKSTPFDVQQEIATLPFPKDGKEQLVALKRTDSTELNLDGVSSVALLAFRLSKNQSQFAPVRGSAMHEMVLLALGRLFKTTDMEVAAAREEFEAAKTKLDEFRKEQSKPPAKKPEPKAASD